MVSRGDTDDHFRRLGEEEGMEVLLLPHSFSYQTTAFKEASMTTKVCHISNPSNVGTKSGTSLNLCQKATGNILNPPDRPLLAFCLYSHPLLADIKCPYWKVKVSQKHRKYQVLVFFLFYTEKLGGFLNYLWTKGSAFWGVSARY